MEFQKENIGILGRNKFSPKTYPSVFKRHIVFDKNTLPYVPPRQSQTNIDVSPHLATFAESSSKLQAYDNHNSGKVQADSTQVTCENATTTTHIHFDDESVIDPSGAGLDDDHEKQVDGDDPDSSNETQIDEALIADLRSASGSEELVAHAGPVNGGLSNPTFSVSNPQEIHLEHHQPEDTTLQSTTFVDVLLAPQGHHMITRHKANEQHLSLVARSSKEILKEPNITKKALRSPRWLASMQEEINVLHTTKTWILVSESLGINLVSSKWMFKTKLKVEGTIDRYKAKLVAMRFCQLEGINFEDTFSPMVNATIIRVVLSIAINSKWEVR
ncbi:hypothetical protein KY285_012951 [Solanum tuberosum]|nr:hypothetical protein KY285_012951 [Solanum tuberosum]